MLPQKLYSPDRHFIPLLITLLYLLLSSFSHAFDMNIYEEEGRIICGNGSKEYRDSLIVLHLKGNALEIGYQYGRLMGADIVAAASFWSHELPRFSLQAAADRNGISALHLETQILPNFESHLPLEYANELHSIAFSLEDKVTFKQLIHLQASYDLYQFYKGITVAGNKSATRSGTFVIGRNIDSFGAGYLNTTRVVAFYEPLKGMPYVTVNPPGMIGATDGMNVNGLVLCYSPLPDLEPRLKDEVLHYDGVPITLLLRQVLQYASSLNEAITMIVDAPRTRGGVVFLADAESGRMVLLEFTADTYELYTPKGPLLWSTDHYRTHRLSEALYKRLGTSYLKRYRARDTVLDESLAEAAGVLDLDAMVRLLRLKNSPFLSEMAYWDKDDAAVSSVRTLGSFVFVPAELQFWVAGTQYLPAPANRYIGFSLYNELDLDESRKASVEHVPRADRTLNPIFKGVQLAVQGDSLIKAAAFARAVPLYEKALVHFSQVAKLENSLVVYEKLAAACKNAGEYQKAFEVYAQLNEMLHARESTIKIREQLVRISVKYGVLFDAVGLHAKAHEKYREALAIRDIYTSKWQDKAQRLLKGGTHE